MDRSSRSFAEEKFECLNFNFKGRKKEILSTRAVIAVRIGDVGIKGVYHHFDGYPDGLGSSLYDIVDLYGYDFVKENLIDAHPSGWSSILEYLDDGGECYCHSNRDGVLSDVRLPQYVEDWKINVEELFDDGWIEYVYIVEPDDTITSYVNAWDSNFSTFVKSFNLKKYIK